MSTDSEIIDHKSGGTTFAGPDAVRLFAAASLRSAIGLWVKTKMTPTRGMTISRMLGAATQYTGQKYTTRQAQKAHDDIGVWVQTMKSALPRREG